MFLSLKQTDRISTGSRPRWLSFHFGLDIVPIVLALVLAGAAALKAYQLLTPHLTYNQAPLNSRWITLGSVICEILLSFWLVSGLWAKQARHLAMATFLVLASVSLYWAASGAESCGCFGPVKVNPWYTAIFDLAALLFLAIWRPAEVPAQAWRPVYFGAPVVSALLLVLGLAAAKGMSQPAFLSDDGEIIGNGDVVFLEPDKWVGKRLPLLKHIDVGDHLASGQWIVLLYRHDCQACARVMTAYEEQAHNLDRMGGGAGIAFVELPPFGELELSETGRLESGLHGRLDDTNTKEWFIRTPVILKIADGVVLVANTGVPEELVQ